MYAEAIPLPAWATGSTVGLLMLKSPRETNLNNGIKLNRKRYSVDDILGSEVVWEMGKQRTRQKCREKKDFEMR